MKITALVVGDETKAGVKDPTKKYRTLALVDQDPDTAHRLQTMFGLSVPEDTNNGEPLSGAVVTCGVTKIEESEWKGLQFRGSVLSVEGVMKFERAKAGPGPMKG